jgi:hypothetical protein
LNWWQCQAISAYRLNLFNKAAEETTTGEMKSTGAYWRDRGCKSFGPVQMFRNEIGIIGFPNCSEKLADKNTLSN